MINTKNSSLSHPYKYALISAVAIGSCFVINPASARPPIATAKEAATKFAEKPEGIYVVINAKTDKGILEGIGPKLKDFNVQFDVKSSRYNSNNQLTMVEVEVNVPGVYKGSLTAGNGSEPISKNLVFFHELAGNKVGLTSDGSIPQALSERGRLVVDNNLNGVLILFNSVSMQFQGHVRTNWQHL